jgi:hypothetical protein
MQGGFPAADILSPLTGIMPRWLIDILLAVGLTAGASYAAEPVAVLARRRRQGTDHPTTGHPTTGHPAKRHKQIK